jgi:hypothetical protein
MVEVQSEGPLTLFCVQISSKSDQVDPLLRGSFLKHSHEFLVSRRSGGLAGTGLQFEVDKLRLVLVLGRKDFREQGQNRLEPGRLEFSPMAGEAGLLDREPHLVLIGSDFMFLMSSPKGEMVFSCQ